MKKVMKLFTLLLFALLVSATVVAQNPGDPDVGDPDVGAPLDEGILASLVAGLGIGFYKFVFKREKK